MTDSLTAILHHWEGKIFGSSKIREARNSCQFQEFLFHSKSSRSFPKYRFKLRIFKIFSHLTIFQIYPKLFEQSHQFPLCFPIDSIDMKSFSFHQKFACTWKLITINSSWKKSFLQIILIKQLKKTFNSILDFGTRDSKFCQQKGAISTTFTMIIGRVAGFLSFR